MMGPEGLGLMSGDDFGLEDTIVSHAGFFVQDDSGACAFGPSQRCAYSDRKENSNS